MTAGSSEYDHMERWRQWQAHNVVTDRRSALQVRIVFAIASVAVGAWLAMQFLAA